MIRGAFCVLPAGWQMQERLRAYARCLACACHVLLLVSIAPAAERAYQGFTLLPENGRYFQYRGKPFVSVGYRGARGERNTHPQSPLVYYEPNFLLDEVPEHGNAIFLRAAHKTTASTWKECLEAIVESPEHWGHVRRLCKDTFDRDMMLTIYCWSYKWNFSKQAYTKAGDSDMCWKRPDQPIMLEPVVSWNDREWSRRDIHLALIDRLVAETWDYPNIVYNFMWEYQYCSRNPAKDPSGAFHRWWADTLRERGCRHNPNVTHLISIEYGRYKDHQVDSIEPHGADFVHFEGGITKRPPADFQKWQVPLVHWSLGQTDHHIGGYVDGKATLPWIRERVLFGYQPSDDFDGIESDALDYLLPLRWYLENIRSWEDEHFADGILGGGDEINEKSMPAYCPSARPRLLAVKGFQRGARRAGDKVDFCCRYTDPEGERPAQAEVWIDRNADGRFNPNPNAGERIPMKPSMTQNEDIIGVLYTASVPDGLPGKDLWYQFRFADRHWYPPFAGPLVPKAAYAHLVLLAN